jgi:hypothetical protein
VGTLAVEKRERSGRLSSGRVYKKSSRKPTKYNFGDCRQVRPRVWNIPTNLKGGLEDAADLPEVCEEAQTVFGRQKLYGPRSPLHT